MKNLQRILEVSYETLFELERYGLDWEAYDQETRVENLLQ